MMTFYYRLQSPEAGSRIPAVRRFKNLAEMNADRDDPYRRESG
ncbi:MAG: hypothetical protein AAFY88_05345 [Acidobacteriota bacterium]